MANLKQMITSAAVHSRQIEMRTHVVGKDRVIVEGRLRDDGHQTVFNLTGERRAPGPIHHLDIRLLLQASTKEILEAEAEMIHVPHEECKETLGSLKDFVGLKIESGFVKRVLNRIGGVKGCSHLTHLLTVMSQEVFQGCVAVERMEPTPLPKSIDEIAGLENLVGSCKMWDRGGIKLRTLGEAIDRSPENKK